MKMSKRMLSLVMSICMVLISCFAFPIYSSALSSGEIPNSGNNIYNPQKAVAYANQFWSTYNSYYPNYKSSFADCANFVSQCLMYGGLKANTTWHGKSSEFGTKQSGPWIECVQQFYYLTGANFDGFNASLTSHLDYDYLDLRKIAKAGNTQALNNAKQEIRDRLDVGDIVYIYGTQGSYGHAMIVIGFNAAGEPCFAGHTSERNDVKNGIKASLTYYLNMVLSNDYNQPGINAVVFMHEGEKNARYIHFNANGGYGNIPDSMYGTANRPFGRIGPAIPTKDGYVFMGWSATNWGIVDRQCIAWAWYLTENDDVIVPGDDWKYEDYCRATGGNPNSCSLTLYAMWKKQKATYSIVFYRNDGTNSVFTTKSLYGYETDAMGDIISTVPKRTGYTFMGWSATPNWSQNNRIIVYSPATNCNAFVTSGQWSYIEYCNRTGGSTSQKTLTLYAQWKRN